MCALVHSCVCLDCILMCALVHSNMFVSIKAYHKYALIFVSIQAYPLMLVRIQAYRVPRHSCVCRDSFTSVHHVT